ncbi:Hypothetical protein CAP_1882 [Chondromyces apiculatus DSM 436]|uniref:Uncharacterized protein n=1 Tax=Chondromyces apiculatus DSM 436 TaxID=1192034 RepID=A0A017TBQ4_9BACT|nr:Hypothetical protein CAP_1882 [Chondromyces apiculatus DSM 436]
MALYATAPAGDDSGGAEAAPARVARRREGAGRELFSRL